MPGNGKYTDEEVRKILDRALRGEPDQGTSHDELVAIASEVGVSRDSIDRAAQHLRLEAEREQSRGQILGRRRRYFSWHAFTFAVVNAFLFAINYLTTPGQWWVLFPVFGWGLFLTFHARFALSREVSAKALLEEQRRRARLERHGAFEPSERAPRARVADTPPASSESNVEAELDGELGARIAEVARRRE